jgi:ABC-type dipeptide/oligopeptide/nickel transport system permease subunit
MAVLPGLTISLAVFGLDLSGDLLRDIADPQGRRGCAW